MLDLKSFQNTKVAFSHFNNAKLRKAYWLFYSMKFPLITKVGMNTIRFLLNLGFPIKILLKNTIFEHFCGGESINDCDSVISKLGESKIGTILDYSVEGEDTEKAFDLTAEEIKKTIQRSKNDYNIPFSVFKPTGIASFNLMQKVQEGVKLTEQETANFENVKSRFNTICKTAYELQVPILIDAEESWIQDTIDNLVLSMMKLYNKEKVIIYNTIQFYRKDALDNLKMSFQKALDNNFLYGIKMVRGAYMEQERERAKINNYPSPIHNSKIETDECYDKGLQFCIENNDRISLCAGTHNEKSSILLTQLIDNKQIDKSNSSIYFAQLYGMSDHISFNLSKEGYNVAKYVPYGPVKSVMPYLFRRAEENTSIAGQTGRELLLIEKEIKRRKHSI